jgi:DNA-binding NarL/FixJ family response regulator
MDGTVSRAPLRCVVADDHPGVLAAVADLLASEGFTVEGQARDGVEAERLIGEKRPDVAIVDVRLPERSGIEVARRAATVSPGTRIILYTAHGDAAQVTEALDAGAKGFVRKDAPLGDLVRAIDRAAAGETYVDPILAGLLVTTVTSAPAVSLTRRERDILRLLAEGCSNAEIGKALFLSPETVRAHVRQTMTKLGAQTRTQAVAIALRRSLIS